MVSTEDSVSKVEGATAAAGENARGEPKDDEANDTQMDQVSKAEEEAPVKSESAAGTKDSDAADIDRTWDHTNRKVIVRNTLKFMKNKDVDKLAKSWLATLQEPNSIRISKTKKAPNKPWIQVTLEEEDMVQPFLDHMNTSKFTNRRGNVMHAERADADRDNRKRKNGGEDERDAKRRKPSGPKTDDEVRDTITPLWRQSYEKQLDTKQRDMIKKCANKIVQEVKKKFRNIEKESRRNEHREAVPVYDWVNGKKAIDVQSILPSPKQTQYRNKCEMNFGYRYELDARQENTGDSTAPDLDANTGPAMSKIPSVGFMASGWAGGVSHPHMLANIPSEACAIVDVVNAFLKDSPTLPYDSKAHRGLWRVMTVRTSRRTKECMVIIMHAPPSGGLGAKDETDDYSRVFESEKARLVSMLTGSELTVPKRDYKVVTTDEEAVETSEQTVATGQVESRNPTEADESPDTIRVTSVFFQEYDGVSSPSPEHPVQHAFGKRTIHEQLGKCTFQISPGAFFQVNTEGAETLYNQVLEKVREVSPKPQETLLFDVCCGTGTIGQYCLKEGVVGRVVGVDISAPAIEDAKANAELNGFGSSGSESERTRFVAARAEQVLAKEIRKEGASTSVIAVVDPARDGLHSDVLKTLRINGKIQRIVYVSCNPTGSLVENAGRLCAPPTKKYPGRPFYPSSAQPVDMFPLTPHCEMVMTFDRLPETVSTG